MDDLWPIKNSDDESLPWCFIGRSQGQKCASPSSKNDFCSSARIRVNELPGDVGWMERSVLKPFVAFPFAIRGVSVQCSRGCMSHPGCGHKSWIQRTIIWKFHSYIKHRHCQTDNCKLAWSQFCSGRNIFFVFLNLFDSFIYAFNIINWPFSLIESTEILTYCYIFWADFSFETFTYYNYLISYSKPNVIFKNFFLQ